MLKFCYLFLVFTTAFTPAYAQVASTPKAKTDLRTEVFQADSSLFAAFNACDSVGYKNFFTQDLEFYHDLGGLSVGLQIEMQSFREMCARGSNIRRELDPASLEVYPIKDYGAIEIGVHRFFHTNKGEKEKPSGTYKFVQVWQKKDNQWKLARVISYGHDSMKND